MNLGMEDKKDICRRIYDEQVKPKDERDGGASFMDGLWFGLMCAGMKHEEFDALERELLEMFDGYCQGEWE